MASNKLFGSENMSSQVKSKNSDPKGDLAAKLASLPYSFSQTLPSVTKKQNNSVFDRNFPQLDSGKGQPLDKQPPQPPYSTGRGGGGTKERKTEERGQSTTGPTVAEIVAGVAHSSKTDSTVETERNKEEWKETFSIEQVEKTLYSRLIPATKTNPRRPGTSTPSSFSSYYYGRKQSVSGSRPLKRDVVEKNGDRGNTVMQRHILQESSSSEDKKQNSISVLEENRKKSWNVLKPNKTNPGHSTRWTVQGNSKGGEVDETTMEENTNTLSHKDDTSSNNIVDSSVACSNSTSEQVKTTSGESHDSDDYDKFESLLRSMGWNPENGEHGEEVITEEEKAQWLEMHSTSNILSGVNVRYPNNKLACFATGGVSALPTALLRRESIGDSEEDEASSSELEED